ncbi:MAG: sporulation membrane protein YtaF [Hyphomonadaceae bacterium]|nr:sporulation membrane protein YtaF [Clostridia bacterium]
MILSIIVMSISLSMDAFFVGVAYGIRKIAIPLPSKIIICLCSVLYAALALFVGHSLVSFLPLALGKILGAVLLLMMGLWMLAQPLRKTPEKNFAFAQASAPAQEKTLMKIILKSWGVTIHILKNPDVGDMDRSGSIDIGESILLGLALSLDAIGVGIGSALAGLTNWCIPITVGLCQWLFMHYGLKLGKQWQFLQHINQHLSTVIPGALLIVLAILRFL